MELTTKRKVEVSAHTAMMTGYLLGKRGKVSAVRYVRESLDCSVREAYDFVTEHQQWMTVAEDVRYPGSPGLW